MTTERDIIVALHDYFSLIRPPSFPDQWVRAEQVQYNGRRADFMALQRSTWLMPRLHMVEVKTVRSDWIRELQDPDKSGVFIDGGVDFVWLAAPPQVATVAELPPGWGFLIFDQGKVRAKRKAQILTTVNIPWNRQLVSGFVRGIVRTGEKTSSSTT